MNSEGEEHINYDVPIKSYGDFYCQLCDTHMNNERMFESHIKGKRHLKNARRGYSAQHKYEYSDEEPAIKKLLDEETRPFAGLDHLVENVYSNQPPTYQCFLCCTSLPSSKWLMDHITGLKHLTLFLKEHKVEQCFFEESSGMSKSSLLPIVQELISKYVKVHGRGKMSVRKVKSGFANPGIKKDNNEEIKVDSKFVKCPEKSSSSPPPKIPRHIPPTKISKPSPSPKISRHSPSPEMTRYSPPPKIFRHSPPTKISRNSPPPEISRRSPPPEISRHSPPPEISRHSPPPEIFRHSPPPEISRYSRSQKFSRHSPPPEISRYSRSQKFSRHSPTPSTYRHSPSPSLFRHSPPDFFRRHPPSPDSSHRHSPSPNSFRHSPLLNSFRHSPPLNSFRHSPPPNSFRRSLLPNPFRRSLLPNPFRHSSTHDSFRHSPHDSFRHSPHDSIRHCPPPEYSSYIPSPSYSRDFPSLRSSKYSPSSSRYSPKSVRMENKYFTPEWQKDSIVEKRQRRYYYENEWRKIGDESEWKKIDTSKFCKRAPTHQRILNSESDQADNYSYSQPFTDNRNNGSDLRAILDQKKSLGGISRADTHDPTRQMARTLPFDEAKSLNLLDKGYEGTFQNNNIPDIQLGKNQFMNRLEKFIGHYKNRETKQQENPSNHLMSSEQYRDVILSPYNQSNISPYGNTPERTYSFKDYETVKQENDYPKNVSSHHLISSEQYSGNIVSPYHQLRSSSYKNTSERMFFNSECSQREKRALPYFNVVRDSSAIPGLTLTEEKHSYKSTTNNEYTEEAQRHFWNKFTY